MAKTTNKKFIITEKTDRIKKAPPSSEIRREELLFKKTNYYYVIAGVALVFIGFLLMAGGRMPSPDVWDDNLIYSPVRTIIAPIVILFGLVVVLFSIFKK